MIPALVILASSALFSHSAIAGNMLSEKCIDITFQRQDRWPELSAQEIFTKLETADLNSDIEELIKNPGVRVNPWMRMMVPHLHERMLGFYEAIYQVTSFYNMHLQLGSTRTNWEDEAKKFFSEEGFAKISKLVPTPDLLGAPTTPDQLRAELLSPRTLDETGLGGLYEKYPEIKKIACQMMDFKHMKACLAAFESAYQKLYHSGNTYNIANGWLVDVLTSNTAAKGGFKLVSKMLDRITTGDFTHASLIDDAKQSYLDAGYSEKDAIKWSQDIILMSNVHGQLSWESYKISRLIQPFNHLNMSVAYAAAMFGATLDSMMMKKENRMYTTPQQISNPCDNGKAYHFIVPWYIANHLRAENFPESTSRAIPFIFEWGYQMFSNSYGRDPILNAKESYDSPRNQSNRLDLVFAGMAVGLGASEVPGRLNFDQNLKFNLTQNSVKRRFRKGYGNRQPSPLKTLLLDLHRYPPKRFLNQVRN